MELQLSLVILCSFLLQESSDSYTSPSPLSAHHNHHLRKKFHHGRQNVPSPSPSPLPSSTRWTRKGPLPLPAIPSNHLKGPSRSPTVSPMSSPAVSNKKYLPPLPSMALPPPPPNQGCASVTCTEPLTYTPPGKSCACVWPIQVRLRFRSRCTHFSLWCLNLLKRLLKLSLWIEAKCV